MALIHCPECKNQVSDCAENCPKCGYPIAGRTAQAHGGKIQTIEQTSKQYKLQELLSASVVVIGLILLTVGLVNAPESVLRQVGIVMILAGFIWFAIIRVVIWWQHG